MRYCPSCGITVPDGEGRCPACQGEVRGDLVSVEKGSHEDGGQVSGAARELVCAHCGKGRLVGVESGQKPLFLCDSCKWYYGDFLHLGTEMYYSTHILKVGTYLRAQTHSGAPFVQELGEHSSEEGLQALASRISVDTNEEKPSILEALRYCIDSGVIELYEDMLDGRKAVGLRLVAKKPQHAEAVST